MTNATELYDGPATVLKIRQDWLKQRLKTEKAELDRLTGILDKDRSEGLAKLVSIVEGDVTDLAALVAEYGTAIRKLKAKKR